MGAAVRLVAPIPGEILPRVRETILALTSKQFYGVVVGGDNDGVYVDNLGDSTLPLNQATIKAGEGIRICTRGRCIARVATIQDAIQVGDPLAAEETGLLEKALVGEFVAARALQSMPLRTAEGDQAYIAIDVKREGKL